MRKGYSLLLLLICFFGASAQNWAPINTTDKYNYKLDTASAISHTLWVDSVQVIGGDTVYFMNRIVLMPTSCDTCPYMGKTLMNQSQFLQKLVRHDSFGIYHFNQPNNIAYFPFAVLNDTWIYDSVQHWTATVTRLDTSTVFGTIDSIKVVSLSNGDSIIVSKSYGFLVYPKSDSPHKYFSLVGIEGQRNFGQHVMKIKDILNLQQGDEFIYLSAMWNWSPGLDYYSCYEHVIITDVAMINDTLMITDSILNGCRPPSFPGTATTTKWNTTSLLDINLYPNSMMQIGQQNNPIDINNFAYNMVKLPYAFTRNGNDTIWNYYGQTSFDYYWPSQEANYFVGANFYLDSNNVTNKVMNVVFGKDSNSVDDTLRYILTQKDRSLVRVFKERLGLTNYNQLYFETAQGINLFGYKLAGTNTWVYDSTFADAIQIIPFSELPIIIQPNPITTTLNILVPEATNTTIRLLDFNGSEVLVQQSNDGHISINTSSLPAGLYIVEVRTIDGVGRKKVIKL